MKKYLILLFTISCFWQLAIANTLTLIKDKKVNCEIIVGKKPVRAAQFAALELQHALKRISSCKVNILDKPSGKNKVLIYVGQSEESKSLGFPNKELKREFYLVDFKDNNIYLMGNDMLDYGKVDYSKYTTFPRLHYYYRATTYAVYDFIEKALDVRYYGPGDLGMVVPNKDTIEVKPYKEYREPSFHAFRSIANYQIEPGMKRDYEIMFLRWRLNSMHGMANHSTWGIFYRYWAKAKPADRAKLFIEKRPEYFAQGYKGRLAAYIGIHYPDEVDLPPQLCLTNPGTLKYFIWEATQYVSGKMVPGSFGCRPLLRDHEPYYIFQEDDNNYFCKCKNCQDYVKKHSYLELRYHFINEIAKAVKATNPKAKVATLCYSSATGYPKQKLENNISVMPCLSLHSYYHPLIYKRQHDYYKMWVNKEGKNRPLMVYTYMRSPAVEARSHYRYNKFFPFLYPWKTGEYMKEFADDGIIGWFGEINLQQHMLECYIASKIIFDKNTNYNQIIDEFFTRYYGSASKEMKDFYSTLEKIFYDLKNMPEIVKNHHIRGSYIYGYHSEKRNWHYGTPERMKMLQALLEKAYKKADNATIKARLKRFEDLIWRQAMEGRKEFEKREKNRNKPISQTIVKRIANCNGNLDIVPFNQAKPLPEWRTLDGEKTNWKPEISLLMDSKYLYIKYVEKNTPMLNRLEKSFYDNDLEIFLSKRPGADFYQLSFTPYNKQILNETTVINGAVRTHKVRPNLIKYKNLKTNNTWTVLVAVPYATIPGVGPAVTSGENISANIFRSDFYQGKFNHCSWSPIYTTDYREGMLKPGVIFLTPEVKAGFLDFNGSFNKQSNSTLPNFYRELKKKSEVNALSCQDGIVNFGTKEIDLKRYRYLLSTKKFTCKEGDKITITFDVKGKGLFAPGMYFYYDAAMGWSFLEHKRSNLNSPEKFEQRKVVFEVKSRPGKIPGKFSIMFYAFPKTKLELRNVNVYIEPVKNN